MYDNIKRIRESFCLMRQTFGCYICRKVISDSWTIHCGHTYCKKCVERLWLLKKNCPMCVFYLVTDQNNVKNDEFDELINQFRKLELAFKVDSHIDLSKDLFQRSFQVDNEVKKLYNYVGEEETDEDNAEEDKDDSNKMAEYINSAKESSYPSGKEIGDLVQMPEYSDSIRESSYSEREKINEYHDETQDETSEMPEYLNSIEDISHYSETENNHEYSDEAEDEVNKISEYSNSSEESSIYLTGIEIENLVELPEYSNSAKQYSDHSERIETVEYSVDEEEDDNKIQEYSNSDTEFFLDQIVEVDENFSNKENEENEMSERNRTEINVDLVDEILEENKSLENSNLAKECSFLLPGKEIEYSMNMLEYSECDINSSLHLEEKEIKEEESEHEQSKLLKYLATVEESSFFETEKIRMCQIKDEEDQVKEMSQFNDKNRQSSSVDSKKTTEIYDMKLITQVKKESLMKRKSQRSESEMTTHKIYLEKLKEEEIHRIESPKIYLMSKEESETEIMREDN